MNLSDKEFYLYRILSGCIRCRIYESGKFQTLLLKNPTLYEKYMAEELYRESLITYKMQGLLEEDDLLRLLVKRGLWSKQEEERLKSLDKEIEGFKTKLYKLLFKSKEKKIIKECIKKAKEEKDRLLNKKHTYTYMSASGAAGLVKSRFLIGAGLFFEDGTKVYQNNFWDKQDSVIDSVVAFCNSNRIEETVFRELSRTEPWRSLWVTKKATNKIFDISSSELTDEQKTLVYWTCLFDSIYENPNCPVDEVIEDDDALDGWLIDQEKNRKSFLNKKSMEDMIPENMKNASEIFIFADTNEDAQKIYEMNDNVTRGMIKQREKTIDKKGFVYDDQLPDVKRELQMQMVKQTTERFRK